MKHECLWLPPLDNTQPLFPFNRFGGVLQGHQSTHIFLVKSCLICFYVLPWSPVTKLDFLLLLLDVLLPQHTEALVHVLDGFVVNMKEPVDGGICQIVQLEKKQRRLCLQRHSSHTITFWEKMQVMRVQVHLAFLGIASKLWTGVGTLVYPALQLPFFTSWACFSTPITQKPIIQEEFDYALLSSIENVDQGSLPSGLLHAEPSGANTLLFPRVGDILPRLCFQGSRPLQDRIVKFGWHGAGCKKDNGDESLIPNCRNTGKSKQTQRDNKMTRRRMTEGMTA